MICHSHPDNVRNILLERNVEAAINDRRKISKMLGTSGMCYGRANVQAGDRKESTLQNFRTDKF